MDLGGHEEEDQLGAMPVPSSYGGMHVEAAPRIKALANSGNGGSQEELQLRSALETSIRTPASTLAKKPNLRYRECLKNHAASIGGHAIDGCGEFMPSGEEGTMEALKCAACDCHRNFHRREATDGDIPPFFCSDCLHARSKDRLRRGGSLAGTNAQHSPPHAPLALPSTLSRPPMLTALNSRTLDREDLEDAAQAYMTFSASPIMKKRFRTKFSVDQKEKMCMFAEKVGWRIQKQDEVAVQQFCAEVGVKRHVLKVWMHNNKHTFGKKPLQPSLSPPHHHQLS